MDWTLDKSGVTQRVTLTSAEQKKLDDFMDAIQHEHLHPATAAENVRCEYKKLKGTVNQYEIYLSINNRATFTVDEGTQTVKMLQIGGHT